VFFRVLIIEDGEIGGSGGPGLMSWNGWQYKMINRTLVDILPDSVSSRGSSRRLHQVIIEPGFGYKVAPRLKVLGGARYNSLSADLNFKGPLVVQVHGEKSWWDPFAGGRLTIPLREKSSISGRLDIGGFGAGSKVAVNAEPLFNRKIGKRGTLNAGWKFYYVDCKDTGASFRCAALSQGPMIGMTFRW
jgi:hypothetical protein